MQRKRLLCLLAAGMIFAAPAAYASSTVTYTYDARGRLVTVVHSGGAHSGANVQYTYDKANNRIRKQVTGA